MRKLPVVLLIVAFVAALTFAAPPAAEAADSAPVLRECPRGLASGLFRGPLSWIDSAFQWLTLQWSGASDGGDETTTPPKDSPWTGGGGAGEENNSNDSGCGIDPNGGNCPQPPGT